MAEPAPRKPPKETEMAVKDADAIHRARVLKGWSQRQLAALCDCTHTAIHNLETGKTVNTALARDLARNLDLPLEAVFEDPSAIVVHDGENRSVSMLAAGVPQ
jgi:ribosome-binding protein aMBF1 (putative translation factor)